YEVTGTESYDGYNSEDDWTTERNVITATNEVVGSPFSIPSDCSVIYVEDNLWLSGTVATKMTVAAATTSTGFQPQIIIDDHIYYSGSDAGLVAIADGDILIGVDVPDDMEINGIFAAVNGRFGRNHYDDSLPTSLDTYRYRNSLTINGTVVSNGRVGTKWTSGGTWSSGFNTRYNAYDRNLVNDPPPLTPSVSENYQFIEWREED
ncbi:MAG: hypothetical protein AAFO91_04325, partial [Bacteroidota bacterium]